jgi:hypothetical protein
MTNSHFRRWSALGALLFAAACSDVTDPAGIAGTYALVEAEGQALPAVVFDGETEAGHVVATALSGTMTLRSSTFTEQVVFNVVLNGADFGSAPVTVSGSYSAEGQLLTFEPDQGDPPVFTGTLSGGVLTTVEDSPDFGELELVWSR